MKIMEDFSYSKQCLGFYSLTSCNGNPSVRTGGSLGTVKEQSSEIEQIIFSINIMRFNMLLRNITSFNHPSHVQCVYSDFQ